MRCFQVGGGTWVLCPRTQQLWRERDRILLDWSGCRRKRCHTKHTHTQALQGAAFHYHNTARHFYRDILNMGPRPSVWTWGAATQAITRNRREPESWDLLFRTYVTILISLICLVFWSYHYWNPMVQCKCKHRTRSALRPQITRQHLKHQGSRLLCHLFTGSLYSRKKKEDIIMLAFKKKC